MKPESFTDFLSGYGEAHPPEMPFHEEEEISEWRPRFRERIDSLRGPLPDRVEPTAEVLDSWEEADHTRILLSIPVSALSTLPAYLLVPKDLAPGEERAGLLVSHGHATYGMDAMCGVRGMDNGDGHRRAYALFAVRAGFVVLAPAWWGWAGRDGHLGMVGTRDRCNVIQMAAGMYGLNVTDLHIQDGQAALDVLASRPEVDAERIGCAGNSYGGRTSMWLTIYDERIKVCVPAGCMNTFRERSLKLSSCGIQYLPGVLRYGDVSDLFCLIAPRPMQLQAGAQDGLITPEDRDEIEGKVRRAYRQMGGEPNLDYVLHPEGHLLRWDLAEPFLRKHLGE